MLTLHLAVVLARLNRTEDERGAKVGQALTEAFVVDMDIVMRKIGIGDPAVPRKVKKLTGALYDRHGAYSHAIAAADNGAGAEDLFAAVINAHMAALDGAEQIGSRALAGYAVALVRHLAHQSDIDLLAGQIDFPDA